MLKPFFDHFAGTFDVLLASHEDEDVAGGVREMDLQRLLDGGIDVVLAWRLAEEDIDREGTPRDGEARRVVEEARELCEPV